MQLTLHATHRTPHGASRQVLAMLAWSVKARRAPSRHRRDARVYGHKTTAMYANEFPTPPPSSNLKLVRKWQQSFAVEGMMYLAKLPLTSCPVPLWTEIQGKLVYTHEYLMFLPFISRVISCREIPASRERSLSPSLSIYLFLSRSVSPSVSFSLSSLSLFLSHPSLYRIITKCCPSLAPCLASCTGSIDA